MQPAIYILAGRPFGALYIGVTSDPARRVWQHKHNVVAVFLRGCPLSTIFERRKQAEEIVQEKLDRGLLNLKAQSPVAIQRVLHELAVKQVELEIQNEELRRTQIELEQSRARYVDLYDLAPVGYLTVSDKGLILQSNLTSANLLGAPRGALAGQPLLRFILPEDLDTYYLKRRLLDQFHERQVYDLRMKTWENDPFSGQMAMSIAQQVNGSPQYRVILSDITERKAAAEEALRRSEEREYQNKLDRQHLVLELEKKVTQTLRVRSDELIRSNNELQ